jgi:hypothetical protein
MFDHDNRDFDREDAADAARVERSRPQPWDHDYGFDGDEPSETELRADDTYLVYRLGCDIADAQGMEIPGWDAALREFRKGGYVAIANLDRGEPIDDDCLTEEQAEQVRLARIAIAERTACVPVVGCERARSGFMRSYACCQSSWGYLEFSCVTPCEGFDVHTRPTIVPAAPVLPVAEVA